MQAQLFGLNEWKQKKVKGVSRSSMDLSACYPFYSCGQHFSYYPDDKFMKGPGIQWPSQHCYLQFYNRFPPSSITESYPHIILIHGSITSTNPRPGFCSCQLGCNLFPLCRVLGQWEKVGWGCLVLRGVCDEYKFSSSSSLVEGIKFSPNYKMGQIFSTALKGKIFMRLVVHRVPSNKSHEHFQHHLLESFSLPGVVSLISSHIISRPQISNF